MESVRSHEILSDLSKSCLITKIEQQTNKVYNQIAFIGLAPQLYIDLQYFVIHLPVFNVPVENIQIL